MDAHMNSHQPAIGIAEVPGSSVRKIHLEGECIGGKQFARVQLKDVHTIPFHFALAGVNAWKIFSESNVHDPFNVNEVAHVS